MLGCCKHGHEPSDSVKDGKFLDRFIQRLSVSEKRFYLVKITILFHVRWYFVL